VHLNTSGQAEFAMFLRAQLDGLRAQNLLPVAAPSIPIVLGLPIRRNDTGAIIKTVQRRLNSQLRLTGNRKLRVDGVHGAATIRAVKRFQKSMGLNQSGVVDRATWDALGLGHRHDLGVLRVGSRNATVKSLQNTLARVLNKPIPATGVFTNSLANDVRTYQRRAGINPDGRVGAETWTSLMVTVASVSQK
jgi:peptidoglycan hydrolase-like protein with peptidoglycan-binding domain